MEIKKVENELRNRYPKMNQVSKKHLLNSIPKKWLKVGLSSLGLALIFKNNVFAISPMNIDIAGVSSTTPHIPEPPVPIRICNVACPILQIVSAVLFIVSGFSILVTKIKAKKQSKSKKVKKWMKVLFIISIVVFILSILTNFIINNYY